METESGAVSTAGRASGPGMARVRSHADSGPQGLKTEVEGPDAHYFVGKKRGQDAPSTTAKSGPACRPRPVVSWGPEGGTAGPGPGVGRRGHLGKGREASGVGGGPGPVQQAARWAGATAFPPKLGCAASSTLAAAGLPGRPPRGVARAADAASRWRPEGLRDLGGGEGHRGPRRTQTLQHPVCAGAPQGPVGGGGRGRGVREGLRGLSLRGRGGARRGGAPPHPTRPAANQHAPRAAEELPALEADTPARCG